MANITPVSGLSRPPVISFTSARTPVTCSSSRTIISVWLPRRVGSDRLRLERVQQHGQFARLVYSVGR